MIGELPPQTDLSINPALIKHVDAEIRDIIIALNRLGFITTTSCAGHSGEATEIKSRRNDRGYINIVEGPSYQAITALLIHAGLKKVRCFKLSDMAPIDTEQGANAITRATFSPVGESWEIRFARAEEAARWDKVPCYDENDNYLFTEQDGKKIRGSEKWPASHPVRLEAELYTDWEEIPQGAGR